MLIETSSFPGGGSGTSWIKLTMYLYFKDDEMREQSRTKRVLAFYLSNGMLRRDTSC